MSDEKIEGTFRFSSDPEVEPEARARIIAMVAKMKVATEGQLLIEAISALQTALVHTIFAAPDRENMLALVLLGIEECYRGCEQSAREQAAGKDTN